MVMQTAFFKLSKVLPVEDAIKYIGEYLSIEISRETEFGPIEVIKAQLYIGDQLISESQCDLPCQKILRSEAHDATSSC